MEGRPGVRETDKGEFKVCDPSVFLLYGAAPARASEFPHSPHHTLVISRGDVYQRLFIIRVSPIFLRISIMIVQLS